MKHINIKQIEFRDSDVYYVTIDFSGETAFIVADSVEKFQREMKLDFKWYVQQFDTSPPAPQYRSTIILKFNTQQYKALRAYEN